MSKTKKSTESAYEGHGENSQPPSVKKGKFEAVGTFMDTGSMTSTYPKGLSVNVKTGDLGSGMKMDES